MDAGGARPIKSLVHARYMLGGLTHLLRLLAVIILLIEYIERRKSL